MHAVLAYLGQVVVAYFETISSYKLTVLIFSWFKIWGQKQLPRFLCLRHTLCLAQWSTLDSQDIFFISLYCKRWFPLLVLVIDCFLDWFENSIIQWRKKLVYFFQTQSSSSALNHLVTDCKLLKANKVDILIWLLCVLFIFTGAKICL